MGESAVLVHSYSFGAPITHNESHEENTIHALSQSVSFGKFMTENLEWGKWSSFSHKKYVEEAEKYSRPGSVAQKKAFFEAHYKRIAEAKKAATEQQSTVTPAEVLLHTLETQPPQLNKQHLQAKEEEEKEEEEPFRIGNDAVSGNKLEEKEKENELIGDDKKEKKQEEDWSVVDEKEKPRRSVTKNRPVFRLSLEKIIPPKSLDIATEIVFSEKTSERPMTQSSEKNEEKPIRFSFLNCFLGNAKAQDKNQSRKKRKTEKKKEKKPFLFLCVKPKTVRES